MYYLIIRAFKYCLYSKVQWPSSLWSMHCNEQRVLFRAFNRQTAKIDTEGCRERHRKLSTCIHVLNQYPAFWEGR